MLKEDVLIGTKGYSSTVTHWVLAHGTVLGESMKQGCTDCIYAKVADVSVTQATQWPCPADLLYYALCMLTYVAT